MFDLLHAAIAIYSLFLLCSELYDRWSTENLFYKYETLYVRTKLVIVLPIQRNPISEYNIAINTYTKQVGLAALLECWLSHLGVAGSSPGHDNM